MKTKSSLKYCSKCSTSKPVECFNTQTKKYKNKVYICRRSLCKTCAAKYKNQWQKKHPEISQKQNIRWKKAHPEKMSAIYKRAEIKKCSTPEGRLEKVIKFQLRDSLRQNKAGRHWEDLLGYTLADLKKSLESKFTLGMTWENQGKDGWHIDHITPRSFFIWHKSEDQEFLYCWSLDNLQPLWAKDNLKKSNKLPNCGHHKSCHEQGEG
jgi:hypothetical protein